MKKNRKLIQQANNLSSLDLFHLLNHDNFQYHLEIFHAVDLSIKDQEEIIQLFEDNMRISYEQSKDGYQPEEKRSELFSNQSRYLIIRSEDSLIAFTHFRFDMDDHQRVLYLYELQIHRNFQGQGLGKWLIEQLKILCEKTQMLKIVLTVQKLNTKAIDFYMKKMSI